MACASTVSPGLAQAQGTDEGEAEATRRGADRNGPPALPLDLGESWVPPIFARRQSAFSETYIALAQERFSDVEADLAHRAERDRYLEVFGIPPTLSVLRQRIREARGRECLHGIDYTVIARFAESDLTTVGFEDWQLEDEAAAERWVFGQFEFHGLTQLRQLARVELDLRDRRRLAFMERLSNWRAGLQEVRRRLQCEGFLRGALPATPHLDWKTRAAIAEFARRHRIYERGQLSGASLQALAIDAVELERRALLRVLGERARLDWGILEDETGEGRNLVEEVTAHLERTLGLHTPDDAIRFLDELGDITGHRLVPVEGISLPDDYSGHMDLFVAIDRGDVRFDPPFDEEGRRVPWVAENKPHLRVYAGTGPSRRLLVEWPTTIGGWRQERDASGEVVWRYKESPVGSGVWHSVVAAPVWLPPTTTPNDTLVDEVEGEQTLIKRTLLGPGYASAYGLVAAIHRRRVGRGYVDEGIRTHGSVDYTSVFGDFSHGCHRLQNHRAVALFSFLLAHRTNRYDGPIRAQYRREIDLGDRRELLEINRRGERFVLDPPVRFEVLRGRVVGEATEPSAESFLVRER